jgi:pyruvate dehydrogenase E2 component (dihydrolipoamide acetyltransferase)
MAKPVIMPKFGFTQETSVIVRWLVQPGQAVEQGDPIAEVSTDKVDMEVEAPESGILDGVRYAEGEEVPVTAIIAYIRQPDEILPPEAAAPEKPVEKATPPPPRPVFTPADAASPTRATPVAMRVAADLGVDIEQVPGSGPRGRVTRKDVETFAARASASPPAEDAPAGKVRAAPAARRLARELGVALSQVTGSGPRGRVQSADVRAAAASAPTPERPPGVGEIIPMAGMRKTIAGRMQQSWQQAPHITFDADIDVTALEDLRRRANANLPQGQPRVSLTALIVKACAWALQRHPRMNARLEGENILLLSEINIGVAVALEDGLIVPVVRQVDQKGARAIAADIAAAATRARAGKLRAEDMAPAGFTISNLGMFGVDRFTAIINPPEAGILAVGRARRQFVPDEHDQPVLRSIMSITLSADHRMVDGAIAARFLDDLRTALEHPDTILL